MEKHFCDARGCGHLNKLFCTCPCNACRFYQEQLVSEDASQSSTPSPLSLIETGMMLQKLTREVEGLRSEIASRAKMLRDPMFTAEVFTWIDKTVKNAVLEAMATWKEQK